jgi:hypothetical protein
MRRSRTLAATAAAGVLLLAQAVGAGPARADTLDMACNYDYVNFNACLTFQDVGELDMLNAQVGLDRHFPQRYAQEIVDYGADFRAQLWADDGGHATFLTELTIMPGWPSAGPDGLGAELLATSLPRANFLDEDPGQPDQDELYVKVSYFDFHRHEREEFRTGTVHGDFSPKTGGGWQCFILC